MTTTSSELPNHIQRLLDQRQQHVYEITEIDSTLAEVTAALGGPATAASVKASMTKATPAPKKAFGKRQGRGSFAVSATDLVLQFLGTHKNPTTREITQHLLNEGRSAGAISNALSVLTSAKKLKRTPLGKGKMGSTYSLA